MPRKSFHKSANYPKELTIPHPGIIDADEFEAYFELHCYEPSPDLQPFVAHIWTQRPRKPLDSSYRPPRELMTGPYVYAFFMTDAAFVHPVGQNSFDYNPSKGTVAGIKFKPGGFYSFLNQPVSIIHDSPLPAQAIFPEADQLFTQALLSQSDDKIFAQLENLLVKQQPKVDKNLVVIGKIMQKLSVTNAPLTVSSIAREFTMSERSLQLLFRTYVGVGLKWVITRQRLLAALQRASSQPDLPWVAIAAELGYSSQSHFSRDFKQVIGSAPSDFVKLSNSVLG